MLKLENIPEEQMPEIVRIASELQKRDLEQDAEKQHQQSTIAAAEEMGLPETYLHQAASELHSRRLAQIELRRRKRVGLIGIGAGIFAIGTGGYLLTHTPNMSPVVTPPVAAPLAAINAPVSQAFNSNQWQLNTSAGTQAKVTFNNGKATINVQRFAANKEGKYFANFNTKNGVLNLSDFRTTVFRMNGTLPYVRLYLENGAERWRSPELKVEGSEQEVRIDFERFERQEKQSDGVSWKKARYEPPVSVENLSFKTGWYVNDVNATGNVELSDFRLE